MPAFADEPDFGTFDSGEGWHVTYGSDGAHASNDGSTLTLTGGHTYTVTREPGASNNCRINFTGEGNVTVNLAGVDCSGNDDRGTPGLDARRGANNTTVHLVAGSKNVFKGGQDAAGIAKDDAGQVDAITGARSGWLTISGDNDAAQLTATGGGAAGIGDGYMRSASNFEISGGTVTATGGGAAGIGGGDKGSARDIRITGGSVEASSIGTVPVNAKGELLELLAIHDLPEGTNAIAIYGQEWTRSGGHQEGNWNWYAYATQGGLMLWLLTLDLAGLWVRGRGVPDGDEKEVHP